VPLIFVPVDIAVTPETGHAWASHWWITDPQKGVAFHIRDRSSAEEYVSPQCNVSELVVQQMIKNHDAGFVARWLPVVFEAHAIREFRSIRKQQKIFNKLAED
jgi:hypothetical protein